MIKNLNGCCNNLCFGVRMQVKFDNESDLVIKFILQYGIPHGTFTQEISLEKGESKICIIPNYAVNVCLNVLNESLPSEPLIFNDCISGPQSFCYKVIRLAQNPICIKSIC